MNCRQILFLFLLGISLLEQIAGEEKYSYETNKRKTAIRKFVLRDYDPIIGPVKFGKTYYLTVTFTLVVTKLLELNTKTEILNIEAWVRQRWVDGLIKWKPSKFGTSSTRFFANEIWAPDIALLNNANPHERLSGGPSKFLTHISTNYQGICWWLSPATFTSPCKLYVRYWPMDTQVCTLTFGSWTFHNKILMIVPQNMTYKKGSVSNGEWTIDNIQASTGTTKRKKEYSTVEYKITLTRKPTYVLFYLTPPVIILVILAVLSFVIPIDSGERISFVTTILLAMMVFLLMMPGYLPTTSDELPILGILLIMSMVIIAIVLVGTIFLSMCHYNEGTPSMIVQKMLFPSKFLAKKHSMTLNTNGRKNHGLNTDHELQECDTNNIVPITDEGPPETESVQEEDVTWHKIAKKLNWLFFLFIFTVLLSTGLTTLIISY